MPTAQDVLTALAKWYRPPEWAFFGQVRAGTGWGSPNRYADAIALNCWPSRGLELHGFEIKVSRGDWLSELRDPAKSEAVQKYCERWWVVAPESEDFELIKTAEVPAMWGFILAGKDGLEFVKEAPKLEAVPLDRPFFASLLRNAADAPSERLREEFKRGVEHGKRCAGGIGSLLRLALRVDDDLARLRRIIGKLDSVSTNLHYAAERTKDMKKGNVHDQP